jgi:hypothetical protein
VMMCPDRQPHGGRPGHPRIPSTSGSGALGGAAWRRTAAEASAHDDPRQGHSRRRRGGRPGCRLHAGAGCGRRRSSRRRTVLGIRRGPGLRRRRRRGAHLHAQRPACRRETTPTPPRPRAPRRTGRCRRSRHASAVGGVHRISSPDSWPTCASSCETARWLVRAHFGSAVEIQPGRTTENLAATKSPLRPASTRRSSVRRGSRGAPPPSVTGAIDTMTSSSSPASAN